MGRTPQLRLNKPDYGTYTLSIRGRASNGIWSRSPLVVKLVSQRYFYESSWFIAFVFLLGMIGIYLFNRIRTVRLKKDKEKLEQVVSMRTEELRQEKETVEAQAKRLQAMDEVKSRFFANISHELRTPLTLILGQINYLSEQNQPISLAIAT